MRERALFAALDDLEDYLRSGECLALPPRQCPHTVTRMQAGRRLP